MGRDARFGTDVGTRRLRTDAERETFGAAALLAPARSRTGARFETPEERFIEELPDARREICRRLIRGLLRGRPEGLAPFAVVDREDPSLPPEAHDLLRSAGAAELSRRLRPLPADCRFVAFQPLPASESILAAPIAAAGGYDRYRFAGPIRLLRGANAIREPHPVEVVSLVAREGAVSSAEQADRIAAEVAESAANLAFARAAGSSEIDAESDGPAEAETVLDVADSLPGADPTSSLERLATEGHPFHPGAKIRRGMTPAESLLYAPEFAAEIDVRFVAVERSWTLREGTDRTLTDILVDSFPGLEAALERAIPSGRSPDEFSAIPIHPWQFYRVIPDRYADRIEAGRVVPIADFSWPATPLSNLRTVVPRAPDESDAGHPPHDPGARPSPHLKLAVDVQLTNVVRTVSPQAVSNGPRVTELLEDIWERESFERLGVCRELAAACYHAPGGPHPDGEHFDDARHLSGLARQNPYAHPLVPDGAIPVSVGSLLATSPVTGRPIVRDAIDRFAVGRDGVGPRDVGVAGEPGEPSAADDPTVARAFFETYVDAVVPEQLELLSAYGVALESHPQNSVVVLDGGRPVAALVRDLGGIRVLDERLASRELAFDAYPDSDLDADEERDLYDKLYYALFQNHFGELIATLAEHAALSEGDCWAHLRDRCAETFETLRANPNVPGGRVDRDEAALFADQTTHKALTAMRLRGKRHEYVTSRVSNPLASRNE